MFISLGPNCHAAGNLTSLDLRNQSLPFDWLLCDEKRVFEYINDLINTNFCNFTTNLKYNNKEKVISANYEYVQFFHHDLLKNNTHRQVYHNFHDKKDYNENLIEVMNRRGKKFMDIISNEDNEVIFLCMINYNKLIKNGMIHDNKLFKDMINFDNNKNIKCKYKVLVYLHNKDDDLIIPNEVKKLNNFIFDKYVKNINVNRVYGDKNDFKKLLEKNK